MSVSQNENGLHLALISVNSHIDLTNHWLDDRKNIHTWREWLNVDLGVEDHKTWWIYTINSLILSKLDQFGFFVCLGFFLLSSDVFDLLCMTWLCIVLLPEVTIRWLSNMQVIRGSLLQLSTFWLLQIQYQGGLHLFIKRSMTVKMCININVLAGLTTAAPALTYDHSLGCTICIVCPHAFHCSIYHTSSTCDQHFEWHMRKPFLMIIGQQLLVSVDKGTL